MDNLKKIRLILLTSLIFFNSGISKTSETNYLKKTWIKETETGIKIYTSGKTKDKTDYLGFSIYYDSNIIIDFPIKEVSGKFKKFWEINYLLKTPEESTYRRLDLSDFEGKKYTCALWEKFYEFEGETLEMIKEIDRLYGIIPLIGKKQKLQE